MRHLPNSKPLCSGDNLVSQTSNTRRSANQLIAFVAAHARITTALIGRQVQHALNHVLDAATIGTLAAGARTTSHAVGHLAAANGRVSGAHYASGIISIAVRVSSGLGGLASSLAARLLDASFRPGLFSTASSFALAFSAAEGIVSCLFGLFWRVKVS